MDRIFLNLLDSTKKNDSFAEISSVCEDKIWYDTQDHVHFCVSLVYVYI